MAFNDFGLIFQTRHGTAIGTSSENRMLGSVGGAGGIRTKMQNNQDGSITMLRTRNGMPEFTTIYPTKRTTILRGFVARVPNALVGTLFSPYTLRVSNPSFTPVGTTYTVLPFATSGNVPPNDATNWNDTLSFFGDIVLVNGKPMASLGETPGVPSKSLPYAIADTTASDIEKYGTTPPPYRVFSASNTTVHSWGASGVSSILDGEAARIAGKALACGVKLDSATHTSKMTQLWFSGQSWDNISSRWYVSSAQISMLLTPPYLEKLAGTFASVQGSPSLVSTGSSETNTVSNISISGAQVAIVGSGELSARLFGGETENYDQQQIIFPWTEIYTTDVPGERRYQNFISSFAGSTGQTIQPSSGNVTDVITVSSSIYTDSTFRNERVAWLGKTVDLPPKDGQVSSSLRGTYDPVNDIAYWGDTEQTANVVPRGHALWGTSGGELGNIAQNSTHKSSGVFEITVGGWNLFCGDFQRYKESGQTLNAIPNALFDGSLSNPYGNIGASGGLGIFSKMSVELYIGDLSQGIGNRAAQLTSKVAAFLGGKCYDTQNPTGKALFKGVVATLQPVDNSSLHVETTDFILYDDENSVFIAVVGSLSGSQSYGANGSLTLTVDLRIETPSGVVVSNMHSSSYSPSNLLPEVYSASSGYNVPPPRLSVMFTPLYREQGLFTGAAYTTALEAAGGAASSHLFNFNFSLGTFGTMADEQTAGVHVLVPCNLLEMLYAYVYSDAYGRSPFDRYPITYPQRFLDISNTLFSNTWHVNYRDGVLVDWLDTLGGAYVESENTELYRI